MKSILVTAILLNTGFAFAQNISFNWIDRSGSTPVSQVTELPRQLAEQTCKDQGSTLMNDRIIDGELTRVYKNREGQYNHLGPIASYKLNETANFTAIISKRIDAAKRVSPTSAAKIAEERIFSCISKSEIQIFNNEARKYVQAKNASKASLGDVASSIKNKIFGKN